MSRRRDAELERRLRDLRAPEEPEAEERSLEIVRAAYADHAPMRPSRGTRRFALAAVCGAVALAVGLSPAGAKVGDLVSDVFSPEKVGEPNAKPELGPLPGGGQLLVEADGGTWVVNPDGSKRRLGEYNDAAWSPHGRFLAAAAGRDLVALEPDGTIRWTVTAPGRVADPLWSPCCDTPFPDYRIAYRSGSGLRVVDGDGTDDRLVATRVAPLAPAWREGTHGHVLTYIDRFKRAHTVDVDSGAVRPSRPADTDQLVAATTERRALSPDGSALAAIESSHGRERLVLEREGGDKPRLLFAARGRLTGPTWSPDGRWLLVGWPEADQWIFIPVDRDEKVVAVERIADQFDPGAVGAGTFPEVLGWAPTPSD